MMFGRRLQRTALGALVVLGASVLWAVGADAGVGTVAALGEVTVSDLRADNTTNPMGTDNTHPSLSWRLSSSVNGERQTAYRILVAGERSLLDAGAGDKWDTGKVTSADSIAVEYGGSGLSAQKTYYWQVQVWDAHDTASAWSAVSTYELGPVEVSDWKGAQWIGTPSTTDSSDAPMLRRTFSVPKSVTQARVYVHGLGFYELHLNGGKVGDRVLTPASTPYDRRNAYDTYDVTSAIVSGANAVGLWLGNGYGAKFNQFGFRWTGPKQAIMLLDISYTDGTRQTVTTDSGWKWSTAGPVTGNEIYTGETYDARQESGWDKPGYNDSAWQAVKTVSAPAGKLVANTMPPLRVVETIPAQEITQPSPGVYVVDFGRNIAGWERLKVGGPAGTKVTMRAAEEVLSDGNVDTFTNRNAESTDTYTLAGTGSAETYEPRFTYHGFRYVEVRGYPGTPTLDSLDARVVHADVSSAATFTSSDPLLNRIWQMNRHTIENNSMSVPTDTPVRDERTPPAMDVQAYRDASIREFGMDRYYANYLLDLPPGTALPTDADRAQQPDMAGGQVSLAWSLYEQYGDRAVLRDTYPLMKNFVDTNATRAQDFIWTGPAFGDWCPPDHSANANDGMGNKNAGDCFSEGMIVNTALSFQQARDVARAAAVLGHNDDASHYSELASKIKAAFNRQFLNSDGASYGSGRQVTSVLPLAFGMVPDANVTPVGTRLVETILDHDGGHLDTGIFGTRYLLDALAKIGRIDVAMTILDQTTYPSFGYELGHNATTAWEQWTYYSAMETHDHAMFAGINSSLYTQLGGIQAGDAGYRSVTIAPQMPETLPSARASIETVRGTITSAWSTTNEQSTLDVTIPVGTTATLHVPSLGLSRATVTPAAGATLVGETGSDTTYTVGSGTWRFMGTPSPMSLSTLPGTWGKCATETQSCSFTGTRTVAFGAHGHFRYATITNSTTCETATFGTDPVPGTRKACYTQPVPAASDGWQQCANEGGTCSFTGTAAVAYGAGGRFAYRTATNGTACTNTVFGDPAENTQKACYFAPAPPTTTTWTPCAVETRTCTFTGTRQVAFGTNGHYRYKSLADEAPCTNAVFGDPAEGSRKRCYLLQ